MPTLHETIAVCQRVNGSVTGVKLAPVNMRDYLTGEVAAANMPYVMTIPLEASNTFGSIGARYVRERRQYLIRVIVSPKASGIGWEKPKDVVNLISLFLTKWMDETNELNTTAGLEVVYSEGVNDSGYRDNIRYGGMEYHGFEMNVAIDRIAISD